MKRTRLPFIELFTKISLPFALLMIITLNTNAQSLFSTVADALNTGGNCYRLTTAEVSKRGAVWYNNKIDLNNNFDISYTLNFGNRQSWSGGDGMAFVLQPANLSQIGISGSGKGYGNTYDGNGNITVPGISPSVVVEYDTYDDNGGTNALVSLLLNGDFRRTVPANTPVGQVSMGFVNDGLDHTCRVTWNAGTKTITAYTDGVQRYSYAIDMAASVFSNQNLVYFGFTAGTGGSVNQQSVCFDAANSSFTSGVISPLASTAISSNVTCHGAANGKATVTVSGGVTPYRISVDGLVVANNFSGAVYSINNLSPGNHTITTTDAVSATSTNNVFISEPALPVITASGPTTFCAGGSVDLSASAAGMSLQFNGLGKYVEAPSTPAISLTNALTVEAWIKTDLTDRPQYIVSKGRDDLMNGQYGILIVGNIFQFHLYQNGHQGVNSNTTIQPGVWYHVAGTWDGITAKIYVNGVLDNSAPFLGPLTPNTQALEIGRIGVVDGNCLCTIDYPFYGEIDEIRIWNNARTASEINNNKNITVAASPALVAYYPFDEGSGSLASDVANGNTATLLDAVSPPQWMVSGAPINYATYAWSSGSAVTPTLHVTTSGSYFANVTSGNGCSYLTNPVIISVTPTPTISASGSLVLCSYNSVVLTSSASSGNSWSNGATTQSVTVTPATVGSYTVTVSNGTCSATSAATVVSNAPAFVSSITASGPTLICDGTSVTYTLNEPVPDASRTWYRYFNGSYDNTFNQTGLSIVVTKSGNYGVDIIDANGCYSNPPGSHDVTVLPPPSKPLAFTVSGTGSCTPNSGSVSATIDFSSGVAPINMTWDDGNGFTTHAQSINNVPPGIYTATVYDYCGTTVVKTFTVTGGVAPVTITASGPTSICSGSSVTLTASPGTSYVWNTGETTPSITVSTSGSYSVSISNGNCVSSSQPTVVTVNASPATPSFFALDAIEFCEGDSVTIKIGNVQPGVSYQWMKSVGGAYANPIPGETGTSLTVKSTGRYTVYATNSCGTTASGTYYLIFYPLPSIPVISTSGATTFCSGNTVTLTSSAVTGNTWSTGETTQSIIVSTSGTYFVKVSSSKCSATSDNIVVTVNPTPPKPTITASGSLSLLPGQTVTLTASAGNSYLWSNGATTQSIVVGSAQVGTFTVTVTNSGCSATSSPTTVSSAGVTPVINVPADITVNNDPGVCGAIVNFTATETTGIPASTLTYSQAPGTPFPVGTTTVTATATNSVGTSIKTFKVTVIDNEKPVFTIVTPGTTTVTIPAMQTIVSSCATAVYNFMDPLPAGAVITGIDLSYSAADQGWGLTGGYTRFYVGGKFIGGNQIIDHFVYSLNFNYAGSIPGYVYGGNNRFEFGFECYPGWKGFFYGGTMTIHYTSAFGPKTVNSDAGNCGATIVLSAPPTSDNCGVSTVTNDAPTTFPVGTTNVTWTVNDVNGNSNTTTQTVTVVDNQPPIVTTQNITVALVNGSVTITPAQINNGSTDNCSIASYSLDKTSFNCSNVGLNTVTLTVKDVQGNSSSATATVTVNGNSSTVNVTAIGPTTFCTGGSVILTSSAVTGNVWSSGETTQSITVSQSGNYSVTATNVNGCTASSSNTNVIVNPLPGVTINAGGPTTFCSGGSLTLMSSAVTGNVWSSGETTQSITVSQSGNYSVTVTNVNGCTASSSNTNVIVNPLPVVSISASGSNILCSGGSVTLTANSGSSYAWSNGQTSRFVQISLPGRYTVTVTDANGCAATSLPIDIFPPNPIVLAISAQGFNSCNGPNFGSANVTSLVGGNTPYSVSWTGPNGFTSSLYSITNLAAGLYTVTAQDACGTKVSTSVTILAPAPQTQNVTVTGSTTLCSPQSTVRITAAPGSVSYSWNKIVNGVTTTVAGSTNFIDVNQPGAYYVSMTDANGCFQNSNITDVFLVTPPATPIITAVGSTTFCSGGSVILTSSAVSGNMWSTGETTQSINLTQSGNYNVTVTNANGCSSISANTTITVNPLPVVTISNGGPTSFCPGGSVILTSSSSTGNTWSPGGATTVSFTAVQSGNYSVKVTDGKGCSATSASVSVTASDIIPPVPSVASLAALSLASTDPIPVPTATDNCTAGVINATTSDQVTNLSPGTYTIRWTYTDNNGNASLQTQTVTINSPIDNTPPAFRSMSSIIKNNDPGVCGAVVVYPMPLANDNASTTKISITEGGGDGTIQFNTPLTNNVSSLDFITSGEYQDIVHGHGTNISVFVELFNPSTGTWVRVQTIQTGTGDYHFGGGSVNFTAISQVNQIRFIASQPVLAAFHFYEMNVNLNSINVVQTSGLPSGSVFPIGSMLNKFQAIDLSGNIAVSSFTVTVNDAEKPTIKNYTSLTYNADAGGVWRGSASTILIADNCPSALTLTEQYIDQRGSRFYNAQSTVSQGNYVLSARSFPLGVNTVLVTVRDAAGNVSETAKFNVTVLDVTNPTIVASGNITQSADPGICGAYVKVPVPVTSDNCSIQSVVNSFNGGPGASGRYPVGTTIVTWTVTDGSGNKTTATQNITITDNEAPTIINLPVSVIQTNDAGTCGAVVTWAPVRATDNCGVISFLSDHQSGETFPLGVTTVTFTAKDRNNNTGTASFTITVTDNEAPKVVTKSITVTLVNGAAGILPSSINIGSFDNCGAITLAASKTNFTCADIGINKVTLTVTDLYGNAASAIALVTVVGEVPTSTIQVTPSTTVFTGGVPTDIYLGYGSQSITLTDNVVGITPITYSWAGVGLNCVSCQNPVFTPTAAGSYTLVATATNKYGCTAVSPVSICVRDIRVTATANSKVYVCHTDLTTGATSTLQMAVNAVANQLTLNPQDLLGSCGMAPCTASTGVASVAIISNPVNGTVVNNVTKEVPAAVDYDGPLTVTVSPNPTASVFTLVIRTRKTLPVSVRLVDESGRSVETKENAPVGTAFTMGAKLITGIYFAEIIQGKERVVLKLIKQNR